MSSSSPVLTGFARSRRALVLALSSIAVATACAPTNSSTTGSSAGAAAVETSVASDADANSTATSVSSSLPTLQELLERDRFVPFAVALERSELDRVVYALDEFVLLAPTDAAFASSGADIGIEFSTLMNNPQLLEAILRYHIVADPSKTQTWRTLNGADLDTVVSRLGAVERVDGVDVLDRISVRNGTVLVISRILLPTRDGAIVDTDR